MEKFELYLENENGQLEINWDSLAIVTSVEYVEKVQETIEYYGSNIISFHVDNFNYAEIVLTDNTNRLFYAVKYTNFKGSKEVVKVDFVTKTTIETIIDYLEGEK